MQFFSNYYLENASSGQGPELKIGGTPLTTGQLSSGYAPLGAVQMASGGYEVAFENAGANQFAIWNADSSGNMTSYNLYSGTSAALELLETSFHQDLNGDGVIGPPPITPVVIELFGSTKLVEVGDVFYLDSISSGTGPELQYGGAPFTAEQLTSGYVAVGAEQTAGGYEVAFKNASSDQFSIWNTDSSGNFLSYAVYSGTSAALESLETGFHQDLNSDGVIGLPPVTPVVIELFGSTKLVEVGDVFYLDSISSGTGPELQYGGAPFTAEQLTSGYVAVGAEQTAGGYEVAFKNASSDQFSIWNTDSSGNFLSYAVYSGTSAALESLETGFHQDLNGDGVIGPPPITPVVIESFGSTKLVEVGDVFYLDSISSGTGHELQYGGAPFTAEQLTSGYVAVGAEQTAGGYEVAFKNASSDQFSIWNTESSGNFLSYAVYSGTSAALELLETDFHQDLNGDGVIGVPATTGPTTATAPVSVKIVNHDTFVFPPGGGTGNAANTAGATAVHLDAFFSASANQLEAFFHNAQPGQLHTIFPSVDSSHQPLNGHDNTTLAEVLLNLHAGMFIVH